MGYAYPQKIAIHTWSIGSKKKKFFKVRGLAQAGRGELHNFDVWRSNAKRMSKERNKLKAVTVKI